MNDPLSDPLAREAHNDVADRMLAILGDDRDPERALSIHAGGLAAVCGFLWAHAEPGAIAQDLVDVIVRGAEDYIDQLQRGSDATE